MSKTRTLLTLILLVAASPCRATPSAAREWNEQLLQAIRLNVPNPPAHARNLFHTAVAMYNAWAAYDTVAVGYTANEKVLPLPATPAEIETARAQAVSFAAYRVVRTRFATGTNSATILASFDAKIDAMFGAGSAALGQAAVTASSDPREVGKRIGQAVLTWSAGDGFGNTAYPQAYTVAVNPNLGTGPGGLSLAMSVLGFNQFMVANSPIGYGVPAGTDPNFWQPLDLSSSVTQNGIPIPGGPQSFVGVQGLSTVPFSLTRTNPAGPWIDPFGGPSKLFTGAGAPTPAQAAADTIYKEGALDVVKASSQLNDTTMVNISPGAIGNNPLGTDNGTGFATNPVAGGTYAPVMVKRGDYTRVLAEYWADGPNSETPPGHWHVLGNQISDMPVLQKKIGGQGPVVNDLEWDVKMYFSLAGATHDAACAAWSLKRYYSGTRPITMIRHLGTIGQLPLEPGVAEMITAANTAPGQKFETILDLRYGVQVTGSIYIGQVAVFSWPGEHPGNAPAPSIATNQSHVRWMLAKDWLPFQRKTFNTPAFPGYVSGHSTFSRSAAEALALITGSPYFPGGFHHHTVAQNSMQIDLGPSTAVDLQWCTYYDAADQAGQSRRHGGIHVSEDDYHGRVIGSTAGQAAYTLAQKYWSGSILADVTLPAITLSSGQAVLNWTTTRGMRYKVQSSPDMNAWTDATAFTYAYSDTAAWTDTSTAPGREFYRVVQSAGQ